MLTIVAIALPVTLTMAALVVDVGDWFTHKRQLQNRADAGALAAGVEYGQRWIQCVTTGDAATEAAITDAGRRFAGDPTAPGTLHNTEIADQTKLEVFLNSLSYDAQVSDGGGPCFNHTGDDISPAGGHWVDVKVKERDLASLFSTFGLDLSRNIARARVEIRPALSDSGFAPLAVPDRRIEKAQLRYFNECAYQNDPTTTPLAVVDLRPLAAAYQTQPGLTYWGPAFGNPLPTEVVPMGIPSFTLPADLTGCISQSYAPVGVEVRIASEPNIDINASCATLAASDFADCFHRLSQIRAYDGSDPIPEPRIRQVELNGCTPDGYFSRPPTTGTCSLAASVTVDWGDRVLNGNDVPANFSVRLNGLQMLPPGGTAQGTWTLTGIPTGDGPNEINVELDWTDTNTNHSYQGQSCQNGAQNPCQWNGAPQRTHQAFVGRPTNAGVVELVRTSTAAQAPLGAPQGAWGTDMLGTSTTIYPTLGLSLALGTGDFTILRQGASQATQLVDCDPPGGGGLAEIRQQFATGCTAWYGKNPFTQGTWWDTATQQCPASTSWFLDPAPAPYTNSGGNPFRCVPTVPGNVGNPVSDGIKIRTGNCEGNINFVSYTCTGNPPCMNPNTYDPVTKTFAPGDQRRIINLFIVPYQALKTAIGSNSSQTVPLLGFASFYVTGWGGNGSSQDRCTTDPDGAGPARPDDPAQSGEIVGYFVEDVDPDSGPVDANATCVVGQLTPCRVSFVR